MAKLLGWLKGASGKLDGKSIYQQNGDTVIRQIVKPKNPQTEAQMTQRAIMRTVNQAYKYLKELCDHSFEGKTYGQQCMSRFMQVNSIHLRDRAAELQLQGVDLWTYYNFCNANSIAMGKFIPAKVFISEGSLNPVVAQITEADGGFKGCLPITANTYAAIINQYGLRRGDQLTFVTYEYDAAIGFRPQWGRVILDPRDANGQPVSLDSAFVGDNGLIVNPNGRNQGYFLNFAFVSGTGLVFNFLESEAVAGTGVIVSRKTGNNWLRSTCEMTLSEACLLNYPQYYISLGAAADLQKSTLYFTDDHYLNNAGQSGAYTASDGGSQTPATNDSLQLNSVVINGSTISAAGGSTSWGNWPIMTIKLQGQNLENTPSGVSGIAIFAYNHIDNVFVHFRNIPSPNFELEGLELEDADAPLCIGYYNDNEELVGSPLFTISVAPTGEDNPIEQRP